MNSGQFYVAIAEAKENPDTGVRLLHLQNLLDEAPADLDKANLLALLVSEHIFRFETQRGESSRDGT